MREWLLLHYRIPREPSASRVRIWRKLKQLGALLLHDAVWVLPANSRTQEQFQWLVTEIADLDGEALMWESRSPLPGTDEELVRRFTGQVEDEYRGILAALEQVDADLPSLSQRYMKARTYDYFQSSLGNDVREKLIASGHGGPG